VKVAPDKAVSLAYRLYDAAGELVDEVCADDPLEYLHGYAQIIPGIDEAIDGLAVGDRRVIKLPPALAFGERAEDAMLEIDRDDFPGGADVEVGDEVMTSGPGGVDVPMPIVALSESLITVDLNHPLAGQTVRFEVEVCAVRDASDEQIEAAQSEIDERIANEYRIVYDSDPPASDANLVQLRRREDVGTKDQP
jgi:FKBP-type peptidyl-prolyl cis-trans isomerase SlyD